MTDKNMPIRPPCLKCGSRNVAWIQWGRPIWRDELQGRLDRREVVLGSCFLTEKCEVWECNECHHRYGSHSFRNILMRQKGEDIPLHMEAQEQAWLHYEKVQKSELCGCYHCLETFNRWDIYEWITDVYENPCPLCPYCGQDSLIGDAHGYSITTELLTAMRNYCYDEKEW